MPSNTLTSELNRAQVLLEFEEIAGEGQVLREKGVAMVRIGMFELDMRQARDALIDRANLRLKRAGEQLLKLIQYSIAHLKVRY